MYNRLIVLTSSYAKNPTLVPMVKEKSTLYTVVYNTLLYTQACKEVTKAVIYNSLGHASGGSWHLSEGQYILPFILSDRCKSSSAQRKCISLLEVNQTLNAWSCFVLCPMSKSGEDLSKL